MSQSPSFSTPQTHLRDSAKILKQCNSQKNTKLKKPAWLKIRLSSHKTMQNIKKQLRDEKLSTVCEEASCPNLMECFSKGTITLMIMGDLCTRRCPFCDVSHGNPQKLDPNEPAKISDFCNKLKADYVVLTSVNRDDLKDGGASHFASCNQSLRDNIKNVLIENLTPDFRKNQNLSLDNLSISLPDVFNHNIETVENLYKKVRPGANYKISLNLLENFKKRHPEIITKSGFMLGLGERDSQIKRLLRDLKNIGVDSITIGQYLQPSLSHLSVKKYITPERFQQWANYATIMGFKNIASAPLVRSSYNAKNFFKQ
ncbi:MAG: lipoyl synthase [Gammaproteobacteria bacterium]|nr:MAG: lipoyl synthase [Gammaproteobacteria bacterium]